MTRQAPDSLVDKLHDRKSTVAVVGLGYVGLPLACALAEAGHTVIGIDADPRKVDGINAGRSHIEDIPGQQVETLVKGGRLTATSDCEAGETSECLGVA